MAIIRLNTEEVFGTDSSEYEILYNAAAEVKNEVPGAVIEIGSRRGGSAKIIIDAMASKNNTNRSMFCVDPYGNIEIKCTNLSTTIHNPDRPIEGDPQSKEIVSLQRFDYDFSMRNRVIPSLYYYAYQAGFNFSFFCLEDIEFFNRFADGVPVYDNFKKLENEYAFVFFDGPHDKESVLNEVIWFLQRISEGSVFVFDDVASYDHDYIDGVLLKNGFERMETGSEGRKISYIKGSV